MKALLFEITYVVLGMFYTAASLSIITLETLYWECVIYLVDISRTLDMSLYDIYTIVFVFLVPYTVALAIVTIVFKLLRRLYRRFF